MATRFKVGRGTAASLPSKLIDGFIWFTTDTGKLYIDAPINGELKRTLINPDVDIDGLEDLVQIYYDVEDQNQVSRKNSLYIFNQAVRAPRIKIGDGSSLIKDLVYLDSDLNEHEENLTIHTSSVEKAKWNNKLGIDYSAIGEEEVIFTLG